MTSYASAGVSIEAGDRAVELMKEWVEKARRPEVLGGIGGFAGLFDASQLKRYDRPLLATSADGVGTKVVIAQRMDVHDTIGYDLVGMLVWVEADPALRLLRYVAFAEATSFLALLVAAGPWSELAGPATVLVTSPDAASRRPRERENGQPGRVLLQGPTISRPGSSERARRAFLSGGELQRVALSTGFLPDLDAVALLLQPADDRAGLHPLAEARELDLSCHRGRPCGRSLRERPRSWER